ncbi:hypothetical protein PIB30_010035 [Stylosanthes scabra]|uniref:Uncharacterized protein n=1 Tax=Stylosanthes scabra TaxID=79078 RepID=A0ABU6W4V5_9FABA|nr:hypothetical protein [Stylosanthes scabra]
MRIEPIPTTTVAHRSNSDGEDGNDYFWNRGGDGGGDAEEHGRRVSDGKLLEVERRGGDSVASATNCRCGGDEFQTRWLWIWLGDGVFLVRVSEIWGKTAQQYWRNVGSGLNYQNSQVDQLSLPIAPSSGPMGTAFCSETTLVDPHRI